MYKEMTPPSKKLTELRTKIVDADGYMAVTPQYNHSTSAAMKNTLDYFLDEYYFKPSAIVSYSVGAFGGINAVQFVEIYLQSWVHQQYLLPYQYLKCMPSSPTGMNFWTLPLSADM
jgi:NAD(P)H-dependent FMN reductase